ncbi:hypothetical protein [Amphibacillus jilinensis]|uniref:hypothetical protein n=1 Tax=Amphibacillus jilinensis TaxID=1216008 RepID=UPI0002D7B157|nr:hypothetical protein [Amphibacillus jilinensis]
MLLLKKGWHLFKANAYYIYLVVAILLTGTALYVLLEPRLGLHREGRETITQLFYLYLVVALINYGYFWFYKRKHCKKQRAEDTGNEG